jgi:RNA methyltransferase, TrmH family
MLSKNQIKFIRSLHQKKNRDLHKLFIAEGSRMVEEFLVSNREDLHLLIVTEEYAGKNEIQDRSNVECVDNTTFSSISTTTSPQGIMGVFKQPLLTYTEQSFMLALDHIQDPGNMGTIIRLADWFGVKQIICSLDCVDIFNPKVIQSSMGSIFRVPLSYENLEDVFSQTKLPIYGALLSGENIYTQKLQRKGILVMGNEGNGIRPEIEKLVTSKLLIPRFGGGESLNVSMATGILLSEFSRNNEI